MAGEWVTALKDAFRLDSFDAANSRAAAALDQALLRTRGRRLRASAAGLLAGTANVLLGYWLGLFIERLLDEVTDGGWSFFSRWVGDLGLLPFVFCGLGMLVLLLAVYRLLTTTVPALARDTGPARFARVLLIAIVGTALLTGAALLGIVRIGVD